MSSQTSVREPIRDRTTQKQLSQGGRHHLSHPPLPRQPPPIAVATEGLDSLGAQKHAIREVNLFGKGMGTEYM